MSACKPENLPPSASGHDLNKHTLRTAVSLPVMTLSLCLTLCILSRVATAQSSTFGNGSLGTTDFAPSTKPAPTPEEEKPQSSVKPADPEKLAKEEREKLTKELVSQIVGAWAKVSTVDKQADLGAFETAAKRCFKQLPLKNLRFETGAKVQLPDISGLFGDVVYFYTQAGIQRLNINSGDVLLLADIAKREVSTSNTVWIVQGKRVSYRLRFAERKLRSKTVRFMLEEGGLYLRCPLREEPQYTLDQ